MSTKRRSRSISPPQTVRRDLLKQEKAYAKAFELLRDDIKEKGVINFNEKTKESKFTLQTNIDDKKNIFSQFSCPTVSGDWEPGKLSDYNGNLLCITTQTQKKNSTCKLNT